MVCVNHTRIFFFFLGFLFFLFFPYHILLFSFRVLFFFFLVLFLLSVLLFFVFVFVISLRVLCCVAMLRALSFFEISVCVLLGGYLVLQPSLPFALAQRLRFGVLQLCLALVGLWLLWIARAHPLVVALSVLSAYQLHNSIAALMQGVPMLSSQSPMEQAKYEQLSEYNQFPYTLEQEVVQRMAPIVRSGTPLTQPSYKPILDHDHNAALVQTQY